MAKSQLTTEWIRVATEGETHQNVPMKKQWLIDIAETYNPQTYSARIWPEHRRWYGAWGDVLAVKTEVQDGKLRLFAKLKPNAQLITANEQDQKVFTSIELDPNFTKTDKAYLTGLGVTDEPASLGTDRLKFSCKERFITHKYGAPEQMVFSQPINDADNTTQDDKKEQSIIELFKSIFSPESSDTSQDTPMDKTQFDSLTTAITGLTTKVGELETKVETFSKKDEQTPPAGDPSGTPPKDTPPAGEQGVTAEQFSTLMTAVNGLVTKTDQLNTEFSALKQEAPGQQPDPAGAGESFSVV
ncbi:GPO family capsid scaffolding protein [Shewanella surugensis]|uniref:GPO family capsid scaffolding protein n=1 Tax=Shewanella surugensis TaxID=212020 RepID=A0ABT0L834_9GAMM|nr:GPO family capsid scaffolding protein [Shewanella surugensis]MCL1123537.1 GPO family capsid scaffolding protein [Shewanella surugensis]